MLAPPIASRRTRPLLSALPLVLALVSCATGAGAQQLRRVTLLLPARPGFDTAGYHVAAQRGYYRAAGLDVRIQRVEPGSRPADAVAAGRAQYGVQGPSLLVARHEGKPIVVLAAIFQNSPSSLVVRADSRIGSPADLLGKRVRMKPEEHPEVVAMLAARGVPLKAVRLDRAEGSADDLSMARTDAVAGSTTELPFAVEHRGVPVLSLRPYRFGVACYGDCLFTSETEAADYPDPVRSLRQASLRGWADAMAHPGAAADIILRIHPDGPSRSELLNEAQAMADLVMPDTVELGHMSVERWRRTADVYAAAGLLPASFGLDGFLYVEPAPGKAGPVVRIALWLAAAAAAGLLAFVVLNWRLGVLVRARTEQLRRSEERLRNIIESIPGAVYRSEIESPWRMDLLSEGFEQLTGYPVARFLPGGDLRFADIVVPEDLPGVEQEVARAVAERRPYRLEYRLLRADGGVRWVHEEGRAKYDGSGKPVWLDGVFVDITERVAAEAAARARSEELDRFFTVAVDLLCIADTDGVLRRLNPEWCRTLGYSLEELEGKRFIELVHPDDVPAAEEAVRALASGQSVLGFTNRYRASDGAYRWLEWRAIPSGDLIYAAARDVTERKRAESALDVAVHATYGATETEFFHDMVRHLAEALGVPHAFVAEIQPDGREARTLAAWIDGQFAPDFTYSLEGSPCQDAVAGGVCHVASGAAERYPDDEGLRALDAESYVGTCLYDAAGQLCGILAVLDRKPMEDSSLAEFLLRIFSSRAAAEIGRLRVERERAALHDQLLQAQKMEAVGQLAGGIAHDFNNLLQVIGGFAELAEEELPADSPVQSRLAHVRRAYERARDLVQQLLVFSRRQTAERVATDLNRVVAGALTMIERVLGEHIECRFRPGEELGLVDADRHQMEQVLMNLCLNARDAMPHGGVIEIETARQTLGPEFCAARPWAREGEFVVLSVRDTGEGMPPEVRERAFEPFFTTKEVGQGTGLGLATVYGIVKQHEGMVDVESAPGQGATFRVYLPVAREPAVAPPHDAPAGPAPVARGETILLAEDDDMVRRLTLSILERAGYAVLVARDGNQAIEAFEKYADQIDLVLVDVVMPGQSGRAVHDAVRRLRPDTPVLFASGYSYDELETGGLDPNTVEVIAKPYRSADLLRRLRTLLDRRQGRSG